jgi:hypothetical protein
VSAVTAVQQIDIEVLADPESCQRTAAQLARLGQTCVQVAGRLGRQAQVSEDDLGGLSGAVYRRSVARSAATCDRLAADCARLADGLADYARDIADVRRLMAQARTTAAPWLTTCDWAIWSPGHASDPADAALSHRWEAWHEAVSWWRRARGLEDLAEQRWLHVLGRAAAPDEPDPSEAALPGPHRHHHPDGGQQPPAPGTDSPVGPIDDGEPAGPVLVTVAGDGPQPHHPHRETGAERVPEPHADHKTGEAMAEPLPVNLPESWAVGAGLGSAGLLGSAGGRDPVTDPEPTDPGPRDVLGAVR